MTPKLEKLNVKVAFGLGTLVDDHRIRITTKNEVHEGDASVGTYIEIQPQPEWN
jgi:hypothetical protein